MEPISLLSSAFGGSLLGAIGAAYTKWQSDKTAIKQQELTQKHEIQLAEHELEMTKLANESKGLDIQQASTVSDSATYAVVNPSDSGLLLVDTVRGLVRPFLTLFLLVAVVTLTGAILKDASIDPEQEAILLNKLVDTLVSCASIALTWWFGARPTK